MALHIGLARTDRAAERDFAVAARVVDDNSRDDLGIAGDVAELPALIALDNDKTVGSQALETVEH